MEIKRNVRRLLGDDTHSRKKPFLDSARQSATTMSFADQDIPLHDQIKMGALQKYKKYSKACLFSPIRPLSLEALLPHRRCLSNNNPSPGYCRNNRLLFTCTGEAFLLQALERRR